MQIEICANHPLRELRQILTLHKILKRLLYSSKSI